MKISLITACFNSEKTIIETLESVKNQNYPNLEYIIVDGGSTDKTLSIFNNYKDLITKIISEKDEGLYDAINKGIREATGEIIGILHSDDIFAYDNILTLVSEKFNNKKLDLIYGDIVFVNKLDKIKRYYSGKKITPLSFDFGIMPPHPSVFIRGCNYSKYGNFNTKYQIASDYDLLFRFIKIQKISILYVPKTFVRMKLGGVSNSSIINMYKLNFEIYKIHKSYGYDISIFKLLRKIPLRLFELLNKNLLSIF